INDQNARGGSRSQGSWRRGCGSGIERRNFAKAREVAQLVGSRAYLPEVRTVFGSRLPLERVEVLQDLFGGFERAGAQRTYGLLGNAIHGRQRRLNLLQDAPGGRANLLKRLYLARATLLFGFFHHLGVPDDVVQG